MAPFESKVCTAWFSVYRSVQCVPNGTDGLWGRQHRISQMREFRLALEVATAARAESSARLQGVKAAFGQVRAREDGKATSTGGPCTRRRPFGGPAPHQGP